MNGIHDMGGMHGFGPVVREHDEPVFHAEYERRTFAIVLAMMGRRAFNVDEFRRTIERIPPQQYLAASYYERWLLACENMLVEKGVVARHEIDVVMAALRVGARSKAWQLRASHERLAGVHGTIEEPGKAPGETTETARLTEEVKGARSESNGKAGGAHGGTDAAALSAALGGGARSLRFDKKFQARFREGDRVIARNLNPEGHTRLPRYARGHRGVIYRDWGVFVFPDTHAHGGGSKPQHCYAVQFEGRELWGEDHPAGERVYIDLWEDYLAACPEAGATAAETRSARRKHSGKAGKSGGKTRAAKPSRKVAAKKAAAAAPDA